MTLLAPGNPFVLRHGPDATPPVRRAMAQEFLRRELSIRMSAIGSAVMVVAIGVALEVWWLLAVVAVRLVSDVLTQPRMRALGQQLADPDWAFLDVELPKLWPRYFVVGLTWSLVAWQTFLTEPIGPLEALLGVISVVAMMFVSSNLCFVPPLFTALVVGFVAGVLPMVVILWGTSALALTGAVVLLLFLMADVGRMTARRYISALLLQFERDRAIAEQGRVIEALDRAHQEATRLAATDSATELPNRQAFLDHVDALTLKRDARFALVLLDLDWFKNINDTLGHHIGDTVLVSVARALQAWPGPGPEGASRPAAEAPFAARLGGDEFAMVLPGTGDSDVVQRLHAALLAELSRLEIPGVGAVATSLTAGSALWPRDAADRRGLLNAADMALRQAKAADRGSHQSYEPAMVDAFTRETLIANLLVQSIEERLFVPVLQPQVTLRDARIVAAELLTRFTHPQLAQFPVQMVFDVAEERGLGARLSATLLDIAGQTVIALQQSLPRPLPVAVNLSPSTMKRPERLLEQLEQWSQAGVRPEHIKLELTEDAITGRGLQRIGRTMEAIAKMGYRIALDDFGTGQSSLSHLHSLPIHEIKIAKPFIDKVCDEPRDQAIVRSALTICEQLGIDSVAEGVATPAQAAKLLELGGMLGQGFLWHRPMAVGEFLALVGASSPGLSPASPPALLPMAETATAA